MHSQANEPGGGHIGCCCYIAVLGQAGSGKTKFIADILGHDNSSEDCGLTAGTKNIIAHDIVIAEQHVRLLDTPGFDNTHLSDAEVIHQVKRYIQQRSILDGSPKSLQGVVYLHRISSPRFAGSSVGAVAALRTLFGGKTAASCIQFLTTFWDEVEECQGKLREAELRSNRTMLKDLLLEGSTLQRMPDSAPRKRNVLAAVLDPDYQVDTPTIRSLEVPGLWPEVSDKIVPKPVSHIGDKLASVDRIQSVMTRPSSPIQPLFGVARATLAMREASLKSREEMIRLRELDMSNNLEKQKVEMAAQQAKIQEIFEERLGKERAAFQSALVTERNHRNELDVQLQTFRELHRVQARMHEAKDKELKEMSKTVADFMTIADRQKQERLRKIGANHETMMHFHLLRDLGEIMMRFLQVVTIVSWSKGPEFVVSMLSDISSGEEATEDCFDKITPCCQPVAYLTRGTWKGVYWNGTEDPYRYTISSSMRGIEFHATPVPTQHSGLYQIRANGCRDEGGSYSISGTFDVSQAHENGRMILQATKDYGTHSWHWDLRASPYGLVGLWDAGKDRRKLERFWGFRHSSTGEWEGVGGVYLVKEG